jgi:hypothetical protein
MTDSTKRYSGPGTIIYSYMNEFMVECPKCKKDAMVSSADPYNFKTGKLVCSNCNHIEHTDNLIRFKAVVIMNCQDCGKHMEISTSNNKEKILELKVSCSHCGIVISVKPRNEEYIQKYKNDTSIVDPVFNLPLWLQTEIRGNVFWAFNRTHLNEIKNYVSSKLRERQTTTHTTMVEKLPNFIKDAKNRVTILKAIEKLLIK